MKRFYPDEYLEKVMPGGVTKNGLLYDNLSIKQRYMRALYKAAGKEGKALKETISKTIEFYAQKEEKMGAQTLLTRRIENFLVWNKVQEEKEAHKGEFYRWMPSDAQNPDPEHQLLYGKIFRVGEGDKDGNMPGERYGCRCGIEWLEDREVSPNNEQEKAVIKHTPKNILSGMETLYTNAVSGAYKKDRVVVDFGRLPNKTVKRIKNKTGLDLKKYSYKVDGEAVKHNISGHGNAQEILKGQVIITKEKMALFPHVLINFDEVVLERKKANATRLKFIKRIGREYTEIVVVGKNNKHLLFKTFYGKQ